MNVNVNVNYLLEIVNAFIECFWILLKNVANHCMFTSCITACDFCKSLIAHWILVDWSTINQGFVSQQDTARRTLKCVILLLLTM